MIKKNMFFYSLILNVFLAVIIIILSVITVMNSNNKQVKQEPKPTSESVKKDDLKSSSTNIENNENILLFGDSITEIYPIDDIFSNYKITGSGQSGYTTNDLIEKIDEMMSRYNPTKVILLIGTNDIMKDVSEEQQDKTINNIKKLVKLINQKRPNAKVYVESIYPVNRNMDKEMVNKRTNDAIKRINKKLEDYCDDSKITYINMYDELTDGDGNFDEKYTYDGLHPSTLGYAKISRILTKYIYE